jgi:hypothetical protein
MMRSTHCLVLGALACASLAISSPVRAVAIEAIATTDELRPGDSFGVTIAISGLGAGSAPSLGVFDVDLEFDPSVLSLSGFAFGDPMLGDQLDLLSLGSVTVASPGTTRINLFELSLDAPEVLDSLQAGSFTLAGVTFDGIAPGTSPLTLRVHALGDALGLPLAVTEIRDDSVSVIPEPGAAFLFGVGLLLVSAATGYRNPSSARRTVVGDGRGDR